jgi:nucleoside-diphosphate-sugar epimerase
VTGAAGYIGSVFVRQLLKMGRSVRGFDNLSFGGEAVLSFYNDPNFEFFKGDIRDSDFVMKALTDVDAVVHLAAIVGDPACAKNPDLAREVNYIASASLFNLCRDAGNIRRFVFASTASNYGKMNQEEYLNENSPLRPVSLYAELKVQFENYLLNSEVRHDFLPVSLRFATVYGISPRMRFDLTVNEFVRDVTFGKLLEIYGAQFWRPYCHVEDIARACIIVLESDIAKVDHGVFNVGKTQENYQKRMIVDEILRVIPDAKIKYVHKDEDPRDYKVDFSKIKRELGFDITRTVPDGIAEINAMLKKNIITDPFSSKYRNI